MLLGDVPIAVDSFGHSHHGQQLLFFCSHAHEDHLSGLSASWKCGVVHCSPVTARFLGLRWPELVPRLRPLELGAVHTLTLGSSEDGPRVEVMLVDANHVPGSVMFVFSGYFGTLLHTGDFRLHADHAHLGALPLLRRGLTRVYMDNTFCHPSFAQPPREEVVERILEEVAGKWPCILFVSVYKVGKELLLEALARRLKTRVLVSEPRIRALEISGLSGDDFAVEPCAPEVAFEQDLRRLSVRGCVWAVGRKQLRPALWRAMSNAAPSHGIVPTGWSELDGGEAEISDDGVQQFPYSDHCSFLELVQFLSWLPAAPVTFLTPLPRPSAKFGYDGLEGVDSLLDHSGVPSVAYQGAAAGGAQGSRRAPAVRRRAGRASLAAASAEAEASQRPQRPLFRGFSFGEEAWPRAGAAADAPTGGVAGWRGSALRDRSRSRSRSLGPSRSLSQGLGGSGGRLAPAVSTV